MTHSLHSDTILNQSSTFSFFRSFISKRADDSFSVPRCVIIEPFVSSFFGHIFGIFNVFPGVVPRTAWNEINNERRKKKRNGSWWISSSSRRFGILRIFSAIHFPQHRLLASEFRRSICGIETSIIYYYHRLQTRLIGYSTGTRLHTARW